MKKFTTILSLAIVLLSLVSCKKEIIGSGPISSETRAVAVFTSIDLRMNGNVYYVKAANPHVEISAKESLLSTIETSVSNGRLIIRYSNGKTYDEDPSIRITVYSPDVSSFELNTSGSIYVQGEISPTNMFVKSAGSGSIFLQKVYTRDIEAIVTQSGNITIAGGTALHVKCKASASATIDLANVLADTGDATTSGSGDILVQVRDYLKATINGSGDIYFRGNPSLSTHINGTGRLMRF